MLFLFSEEYGDSKLQDLGGLTLINNGNRLMVIFLRLR